MTGMKTGKEVSIEKHWRTFISHFVLPLLIKHSVSHNYFADATINSDFSKGFPRHELSIIVPFYSKRHLLSYDELKTRNWNWTHGDCKTKLCFHNNLKLQQKVQTQLQICRTDFWSKLAVLSLWGWNNFRSRKIRYSGDPIFLHHFLYNHFWT